MVPSTPSKKRARLSGVEKASDDSTDEQSPRPITQRKTSKESEENFSRQTGETLIGEPFSDENIHIQSQKPRQASPTTRSTRVPDGGITQHDDSISEKQRKNLSGRVEHQDTQNKNPAGTFDQQTDKFDGVKLTNDYYCEKCSVLDFERIFSSPVLTKILRPISIGEHSNITSGLNGQCIFCKLLWNQIGLGAHVLAEGGDSLLLIASFGHNQITLELSDVNGKKWNGVTRSLMPETGALHLLNPPSDAHPTLFVPPIEPEKIDFNLMRQWLRECRLHPSCRKDNIAENSLHMRLINCETHELEVADGTERYTALSYVWGTPELLKTEKGNRLAPPRANPLTFEDVSLPGRLPLTIEDAMITTQALSMKYLWVDRYCIPQADEKEKQLQIKQMDRIYRQAEVTLVAAAGDDPSFGLPGVSRTPRHHQPQALLGQYRLRSSMGTDSLIRASAWNSRAWTYQEAFCARRLLIFTLQQVFFACQERNLRETTRILDVEGFVGGLVSKKNVVFDKPWKILECIAEFSTRVLTYESDALNAVLGVLRRFEIVKRHPTFHLWGVPILPPRVFREGITMNYEHGRRTWTDGFATGLCWTADRNVGAKRRSGFPTWSWAGWTCSVCSYSPYYEGKFTTVSDQAVNVFVGAYDNSKLHFEQYLNALMDNKDQPIRDLYLEGLTLNISTICFETKGMTFSDIPKVFAYPASIEGGRQPYARLHPLCLDKEGSERRWCLDNPDLKGIFLRKVELHHVPHGRSETGDAMPCKGDTLVKTALGTKGCISANPRDRRGEWFEEAFVMVLKEIDGAYQRVGHIILSSRAKWQIDHSTHVATEDFLPMQTSLPFWTGALHHDHEEGVELKTFEETEHLKPWFESAKVQRLKLR